MQVLVHFAKLAVFIIVPGVHLILSGKKALGWFLLIGALTLMTTTFVVPYYPSVLHFWTLVSLYPLYILSQPTSWIFILVDQRQLAARHFTWPVLAIAITAIALPWATFENNTAHAWERIGAHHPDSSQMCPEFCVGDLVTYEYFPRDDGVVTSIRKGDFVVYEVGHFEKLNMVLAGPGDYVCRDDEIHIYRIMQLDSNCKIKRKLAANEYFVTGNGFYPDKNDHQFHSGIIRESQIIGFNPVAVVTWSNGYMVPVWNR